MRRPSSSSMVMGVRVQLSRRGSFSASTCQPRMAASTARGVVRLQTGRVANYAFAMIIGLIALMAVLMRFWR